MENNEKLNEDLAPGAEVDNAATSENVEGTTETTQELVEDADGVEDDEEVFDDTENDEDADVTTSETSDMTVADDDAEAQHDAVKSEN